MRRVKFITACVCCACLVSLSVFAAQVSAEDANGKEPISPREGAIRLFNGMDLGGLYTWLKDTKYQDPHNVFTIQDGMLHISGNGIGYVCTKKEYKNYHLIVEFKWGEQTWGERKDRARDTGVLVHCVGPDGNYANRFMASIEAQIIEGGVGDFIIVPGKYADGSPVPLSLTAEVTKDRDGETVWKKGDRKKTFSAGQRINWLGRDPDWKDTLGFRGKNDIDGPHGEWTRMEVICDGGHIINKVNGVVVNEAFDAYPSAGKILIQSELAEVYIRRWELWPLGKVSISPENTFLGEP